MSTSAILVPSNLSTPFSLPNPSTTLSIVWVTETVITHVISASISLTSSAIAGVTTVGSSVLSTPIPTSFAFDASQPLQPTQMPLSQASTIETTVITTATVTVSATSKTPSSASNTSKTIWSAPAQITDLSAFNISAFSGGQHNLNIVKGIPANASATYLLAASQSTDSPTFWDNTSSVLQLLYPANSINPGNKPIGGAQFYATPLEITSARSVTLQYSVFFPVDFVWVLAGKLPGLYGGHPSCSGGNDALECFSTRLMWRQGGIGELYLYAPKEDQTESLCAHPQSVCNTVYGLSIGRGSFAWAKGAWTRVKQRVTLNTPGKQDGSFTLDVDDRRVIDRNDIFYRRTPLPSHDDSGKVTETRPKAPSATSTKKHSGLGGLLGPLLGSLFRQPAGELEVMAFTKTRSGTVVTEWDSAYDAQASTPIGTLKSTATALIITDPSGESTMTTMLPPVVQRNAQSAGEPVGFLGLFFSTFFGGHEPQYATPKDQYIWFKDFAISYNS